MPGASNIKAMNQRVAHLEYLYELDGRHHSDHPNHGHYTGLSPAAAVHLGLVVMTSSELETVGIPFIVTELLSPQHDQHLIVI